MICKDCYFDAMKQIVMDAMVYGRNEIRDEDLECDCDKHSLVIGLIEEKIRDNIERTGTWNGIEVK